MIFNIVFDYWIAHYPSKVNNVTCFLYLSRFLFLFVSCTKDKQRNTIMLV